MQYKIKQSLFLSLLFYLMLLCNNVYSQSSYDYNKSGTQKYINGDYQGAIQDYTKAIELALDTSGLNRIDKFYHTVSCGESYVKRGSAKLKLEDYRGAISDYTKGIELNVSEKDNHTYYNRGLVKWYLQDFQGAKNDLDKAIELTPNFANAYYLRGNIKAQLGNVDSACLDWSKAGELGLSKAYDKIKENCN